MYMYKDCSEINHLFIYSYSLGIIDKPLEFHKKVFQNKFSSLRLHKIIPGKSVKSPRVLPTSNDLEQAQNYRQLDASYYSYIFNTLQMNRLKTFYSLISYFSSLDYFQLRKPWQAFT